LSLGDSHTYAGNFNYFLIYFAEYTSESRTTKKLNLGMSHPNSDIICAIDHNFLFDEKIASEDDFILLLDNTDKNIQGLTMTFETQIALLR